MVIGNLVSSLLSPLTKLCITNKVTGKKIYVLYNPESYTLERSAQYSEAAGLSTNAPNIQFVHGTSETLTMELFFDTFSAGDEVGGSVADKALFKANQQLPSKAKMDVRKYTARIYDLMVIDKRTHVPPLLKLEWSSLQFTGHLVSCSQRFTKFTEIGTPVRAVLNATFKKYAEPSKIAEILPNESPDTAKYRTVHQGDALWSFSGREYGQCEQWRVIAEANGIDNPRLLETGRMIKLPALQ